MEEKRKRKKEQKGKRNRKKKEKRNLRVLYYQIPFEAEKRALKG